MSELRDIEQLEEGKLASVVGVIEEVDLRNTGPGKSLLGMLAQARHELSPLSVVQSAVDAARSWPKGGGFWSPASRSWKACGGRWPIRGSSSWPTTKTRRPAAFCPSIR